MGTNFYLHRTDESAGEVASPLHIGKSSMGWCFSLHVYPERGIRDLNDWLPLFKDGDIFDEYGEHVPAQEMMAIISERSRASREDWDTFGTRVGQLYGSSESEFHLRNQSERGPRGLLRHRISLHCVAQGAGTWDCIVGDFS